ncbi:MAG: UbiA family prenyltransferase [Candidatus Thermoplasmatota archaeon]
MGKIVEYLKLSRSFNALLTGVSPVMGAIAMKQFNMFYLLILFLIGFFGHTYGFVLNDILDYKIDKSSKEISDRPLISGTISIRNAWIFATISIVISLLLSFYIAYKSGLYFPIILLALSALFITIYNLISKKFPCMDFFVAFGVFFLILYGAQTTTKVFLNISLLAWIVCILGFLQVLYMQFISGGLKDIENDYISGAKTLAVKMNVRIKNGKLIIPNGFKILAYSLQIIDLFVVFIPFFIIWNIKKLTNLQYFQFIILALIAVSMIYLSYKLLSLKEFGRDKARMLIGSHYMIHFALVPIMLMTLTPWAGFIVFLPAVGYILSNIVIHGTILKPKTM